MAKTITVLVGTRKGAFFLRSNDSRKTWQLSEPTYLGHIVYHLVADPRDPKHLVMCTKAGHLGPTVYYSEDGGQSWSESSTPPQFPKQQGAEEAKAAEAGESKPNEKNGKKARVVESVFWLSPGHASDPGTWYVGTNPPGIFVSKDHGKTWQPMTGFNEHPMYSKWTEMGETPGGQLLHSINIDPRDKNHIYCGISVGGVFESTDGGVDWKPLNKGCAADFMPDEDADFGHDPHCLVMHPKNPDRIYQQNHCGIYRMDRPSNEWIRIGKNMPKEIGDIGFPIVVDPNNADKAWVFPMDGSDVWPRTSPGGKPAVYVTSNAGESWERQDKGLPPEKAYFTVKRQAMCGDAEQPFGLYFGTSQGEVWASADEGENWSCIVRYLPEIFSLSIVASD